MQLTAQIRLAMNREVGPMAMLQEECNHILKNYKNNLHYPELGQDPRLLCSLEYYGSCMRKWEDRLTLV